jgi:hypothetical protein
MKSDKLSLMSAPCECPCKKLFNHLHILQSLGCHFLTVIGEFCEKQMLKAVWGIAIIKTMKVFM